MQNHNMESINSQILRSLSINAIKAYYDGEEALVITEELFQGETIYLLTRGIQEFSDENASASTIHWLHDETEVYENLEDAINEFEKRVR